MDFSLTKIYKNEIAVCALAALGTEKKILNSLAHRRKDNIKHFWNDMPFSRQFRRGQGGWLKCPEGRLMGDRIYSLYRVMYKDSQLDRPLTALQLLNLYYAYNALYPNSNIHPTRIFYFFPLLREQLVGIMPECKSCSKSYVIHYDDNVDIQFCASCDNSLTVTKKNTYNKSNKVNVFEEDVQSQPGDIFFDNLPHRQQM